MSKQLINNTSKRIIWSGRIVTILVALLFAMSGIMKVTQSHTVVDGFAKSGIPVEAILPLGILELFCLILYIIPRTAMTGTLLLTGYLGGAILATLIGHASVVAPVGVGLFVWIGAWLRIPEFRALVPVRR